MQRQRAPGVILGSYAAFPPATEEANAAQIEFQKRVRSLAHISGLEIPFSRRGLMNSSMGLPVSEQLAFGWQVLVTFLPCQMETLEVDPHFGLASQNEASRRAACAEVRRLFTELDELLKLRPDLHLLGISLQSGPRAILDTHEGAASGAVSRAESKTPESRLVNASVEALRRSLRELSTERHFRNVSLEHCDSIHGVGIAAKGFLSIFDEIQVAHEFDLGVVINWGRSCIEGRSARTPIEHLRLTLDETGAHRARLRGLVLSGAAESHPLYGDWLDTHAPIAEAMSAPAMALPVDSRLQLTLARAREAWVTMREGFLDQLDALPEVDREVDLQDPSGGVHVSPAMPFLGLKVQPLPREMTVDDRLAFLERHLSLLHPFFLG